MGDEALVFDTPEVRQSADDAYELGAAVGDHWVVFARIQGEQVRANVANQQANADAAAAVPADAAAS